jgi:hypothetical protein
MHSPIVLCIVTLSMLAACAAPSQDRRIGPDQPVAIPRPSDGARPVDSAGAPATAAPRTYRAGVGTIQSATVLSLSSAPASAGATTGAGSSATMAYRVKMADGTVQDVVQTGERFEVGDRAQITSEGRLVRP